MNKERVNVQKGITYIFPASACAVCRLSTGFFVLVEQPRGIQNVLTIELPGGNIEKDESLQHGMLREFTEETGLIAVRPRLLFSLDLDLSTTVHKTHVFRVDVAGDPSSLDVADTVRLFDLATCVDMIRAGRITHAPTVAAVLAFESGYANVE